MSTIKETSKFLKIFNKNCFQKYDHKGILLFIMENILYMMMALEMITEKV